MNIRRFAGDALSSTKGKKGSALIGSTNSGFDLLGTARAVASQAHPLLGALDDTVSVGEKISNTNNSSGAKAFGENLVHTLGSGLSAVGSLGGLFGLKGLAAANPVGATVGLSTMIAKPAVEGMTNPTIRKADANEYAQAMGQYRR